MKKAPCCAGRFFMLCWGSIQFRSVQFRLGYPGGCSAKYISDYSNKSTITRNISAIIAIYRRFDKGYRLIDKVRQKKFRIYPTTCCRKRDWLVVWKRYWQTHWKIQLKPHLSNSLLNFLTNPPNPNQIPVQSSKTLPHTRKSFLIKKDNLLLFLIMRVQCKIARKDEKYLQDYCVRVA